MELVSAENNKVVYKEKKKIITVIREYPKDANENFSTLIDALLTIIEQEENDAGEINE